MNGGKAKNHLRGLYSAACNKQQTPCLLVRKQTIPTELPQLVDENLVPTFADRGVSRGQRG
jgi:hypothetical protein